MSKEREDDKTQIPKPKKKAKVKETPKWRPTTTQAPEKNQKPPKHLRDQPNLKTEKENFEVEFEKYGNMETTR